MRKALVAVALVLLAMQVVANSLWDIALGVGLVSLLFFK
jgi:hypothetical protein